MNNTETTQDGPWKLFIPADSYDGYLASMKTPEGETHIVDASTFERVKTAFNSDGTEYEGSIHNLGRAESYCGKTILSRLHSLDGEHGPHYEKHICSTCLRALNAREESTEDREAIEA